MSCIIQFIVSLFTGEKLIIRKLRAGELYNFLLSAGNIVGFGKEDKFRVRTRAELPKAPTGKVIIARTGPF